MGICGHFGVVRMLSRVAMWVASNVPYDIFVFTWYEKVDLIIQDSTEHHKARDPVLKLWNQKKISVHYLALYILWRNIFPQAYMLILREIDEWEYNHLDLIFWVTTLYQIIYHIFLFNWDIFSNVAPENESFPFYLYQLYWICLITHSLHYMSS